jgi:hypothetical protein
MSKLFKLKKWLTVPDAAKHLTIVFGEEVTEADVLRFALDGDLRLSVHLVNGAYARPCFLVNVEELEWDEVSGLDGYGTIKIHRGGRIFGDERGCFQVHRTVTELDSDVWDLPLTGGERVDVEFRYQQLTNGPEVTAVSLDGVFVAATNGDLKEIQSRFEDGPYFNKSDFKKPFLHPDNFHPAGALPDDGVFVVRIEALTDFIQSVNAESTRVEKPPGTIERNTLLTIIAALCKDAGYDHTKHAKTAGLIQSTADKMGVSIGETTIEGHLKKIPDALATRMK